MIVLPVTPCTPAGAAGHGCCATGSARVLATSSVLDAANRIPAANAIRCESPNRRTAPSFSLNWVGPVPPVSRVQVGNGLYGIGAAQLAARGRIDQRRGKAAVEADGALYQRQRPAVDRAVRHVTHAVAGQR